MERTPKRRKTRNQTHMESLLAVSLDDEEFSIEKLRDKCLYNNDGTVIFSFGDEEQHRGFETSFSVFDRTRHTNVTFPMTVYFIQALTDVSSLLAPNFSDFTCNCLTPDSEGHVAYDTFEMYPGDSSMLLVRVGDGRTNLHVQRPHNLFWLEPRYLQTHPLLAQSVSHATKPIVMSDEVIKSVAFLEAARIKRFTPLGRRTKPFEASPLANTLELLLELPGTQRHKTCTHVTTMVQTHFDTLYKRMHNNLRNTPVITNLPQPSGKCTGYIPFVTNPMTAWRLDIFTKEGSRKPCECYECASGLAIKRLALQDYPSVPSLSEIIKGVLETIERHFPNPHELGLDSKPAKFSDAQKAYTDAKNDPNSSPGLIFSLNQEKHSIQIDEGLRRDIVRNIDPLKQNQLKDIAKAGNWPHVKQNLNLIFGSLQTGDFDAPSQRGPFFINPFKLLIEEKYFTYWFKGNILDPDDFMYEESVDLTFLISNTTGGTFCCMAWSILGDECVGFLTLKVALSEDKLYEKFKEKPLSDHLKEVTLFPNNLFEMRKSLFQRMTEGFDMLSETHILPSNQDWGRKHPVVQYGIRPSSDLLEKYQGGTSETKKWIEFWASILTRVVKNGPEFHFKLPSELQNNLSLKKFTAQFPKLALDCKSLITKFDSLLTYKKYLEQEYDKVCEKVSFSREEVKAVMQKNNTEMLFPPMFKLKNTVMEDVSGRCREIIESQYLFWTDFQILVEAHVLGCGCFESNSKKEDCCVQRAYSMYILSMAFMTHTKLQLWKMTFSYIWMISFYTECIEDPCASKLIEKLFQYPEGNLIQGPDVHKLYSAQLSSIQKLKSHFPRPQWNISQTVAMECGAIGNIYSAARLGIPSALTYMVNLLSRWNIQRGISTAVTKSLRHTDFMCPFHKDQVAHATARQTRLKGKNSPEAAVVAAFLCVQDLFKLRLVNKSLNDLLRPSIQNIISRDAEVFSDNVSFCRLSRDWYASLFVQELPETGSTSVFPYLTSTSCICQDCGHRIPDMTSIVPQGEVSNPFRKPSEYSWPYETLGCYSSEEQIENELY